MEYLLKNLEAYKAQRPDKIKSEEETLKNASKFLKGRSMIRKRKNHKQWIIQRTL